MGSNEKGCFSALGTFIWSPLAGALTFSLIGYVLGAILPWITAYGTSKIFFFIGAFMGLVVGGVEAAKTLRG